MTWPSSSVRRSPDRVASEPAISHLEEGRLVEGAAADANPVRDPVPKELKRNLGLAERRTAPLRVAQEGDWPFAVHEHRRLSECLPEPLRCFAHRDSIGPCH